MHFGASARRWRHAAEWITPGFRKAKPTAEFSRAISFCVAFKLQFTPWKSASTSLLAVGRR